MKKLFITTTREKNIIRYSETSDQSDAKEMTEEEVIKLFCKNSFTEAGAKDFITYVKNSPFSDWIQWK